MCSSGTAQQILPTAIDVFLQWLLVLKMPDIMNRCLGQDISKVILYYIILAKGEEKLSFHSLCPATTHWIPLATTKKSINKNCTLHIQSSGADRAEVCSECVFWACTVLIFWKEFLLQRTKQKLTNKYCAGQMRCLDLVQWKKSRQGHFQTSDSAPPIFTNKEIVEES